MVVRLSVLVRNKEMSEEAMKNLWRTCCFDVDSLYCLIRVALKPSNVLIAEGVGRDLGIDRGNLKSYMEFIKPYVSERIHSPEKYNGNSVGGCMFDEAQMEKIRRLNSMSPEEYISSQEKLERKFWENKDDMMKYGYIEELFGDTFDV